MKKACMLTPAIVRLSAQQTNSELSETVYVSEDDLDAGEAICPSCKVAFEVALADDEEPEEDDGPVQYEVTCPACGATAVFEEADLLDGEPTCPNCGKPLDFEVTEE